MYKIKSMSNVLLSRETTAQVLNREVTPAINVNKGLKNVCVITVNIAKMKVENSSSNY